MKCNLKLVHYDQVKTLAFCGLLLFFLLLLSMCIVIVIVIKLQSSLTVQSKSD